MSGRKSIFVLAFFTCLLCQTWLMAADAESKGGPDVQRLVRQGEQTQRRLASETCQWKSTIRLNNAGVSVIAEWTRSSAGTRTDLVLDAHNHLEQIASIIERDGFWYVNEASKKFTKYQPHETPFTLPTTLLWYHLSQVRPVVAEQLTGAFAGEKDSIATYRTPVAEPIRVQISRLLADINGHPGVQLPPGLLDSLKDLLDNGVTLQIDTTTGLPARLTSPKFTTTWSRPTWPRELGQKTLDVSGQNWDDHTAGPDTCDPSHLVMLGHAGTWQPGAPAGDSDARLVNIKTGQIWRVPSQDAISVGGCFSKDRKSVVVSAMDVESGGLTLQSIDLRTRANHRIGGKQLAVGLNLMPALSHDGRTLAVLHHGPDQTMLRSSIMLVDLATDKCRTICDDIDTAFLSWLPDDSGIVLLKRPSERSDQLAKQVAVMDLSGQLKALCPGDSPLVISGDRILFEDAPPGPSLWKTCRLDGTDIKPFGDGLSGCGFPTVSPDGRHVLMMHFNGNNQSAPVPTIYDIDGSHPNPLKLPPGLWSMPAW